MPPCGAIHLLVPYICQHSRLRTATGRPYKNKGTSGERDGAPSRRALQKHEQRKWRKMRKTGGHTGPPLQAPHHLHRGAQRAPAGRQRGNRGAVRTLSPTRVGNSSAPPLRAQRHVGSENPGAGAGPLHRKFFTIPGPLWGRRESRGTTQISTRRKFFIHVKG